MVVGWSEDGQCLIAFYPQTLRIMNKDMNVTVSMVNLPQDALAIVEVQGFAFFGPSEVRETSGIVRLELKGLDKSRTLNSHITTTTTHHQHQQTFLPVSGYASIQTMNKFLIPGCKVKVKVLKSKLVNLLSSFSLRTVNKIPEGVVLGF